MRQLSAACLLALPLPSCDRQQPVEDLDVQGLAGQCVSLQADKDWLAPQGGTYAWVRKGEDQAARFRLQAADLGVYLLYDADERYLVAETSKVTREGALESDMTRISAGKLDDGYVSGGEWALEPSERGGERYQLRNRRNDRLLGEDGLVDDAGDALAITLQPATGCADFPELSLDASGTVSHTTFDDGTLYGIADAHSHLFSNDGFGGGGIFHGAPFHRLGVAHALPDCAPFHGEGGRHDFFGYAFDDQGNSGGSLTSMLPAILAGELPEDNHATAGWPDFTDWPDAPHRSTHQTQYYRWLERAWMAGLRLEVNFATSNAVICDLMVGQGIEPSRYDCEDMTATDREIDDTWAMQRYIDAQWGGEGKGWFRVVTSPAEAREVVAEGKLAVVIGIETSDLFRCNLTPRPDGPTCDEAFVDAALDDYYSRGVRAIFPVHKYDNAFGPGDGSGDFIELGNFLNSGYWTNMTDDCPDVQAGFDGGSITFGGLQSPRDVYMSQPPNDLSGFPEAPLDTAFGYTSEILEDSIAGDWCQNATLTDLGEHLIEGMMRRGMIVEVGHLPMWSYQRTYEILEENDYPASETHGRTDDGEVYALGGISTSGLGRCQDPSAPGSTLSAITARAELATEMGGYPGIPLGFDLNGFAGAPGARFAEGACGVAQEDPVTYPFGSYAGDVSFTEPSLGNRAVDFNEEGMIHIGLLPELIEDARHDGPDADAALEPIFHSAEAWIRMWEKAETRGLALSAGG